MLELKEKSMLKNVRKKMNKNMKMKEQVEEYKQEYGEEDNQHKLKMNGGYCGIEIWFGPPWSV